MSAEMIDNDDTIKKGNDKMKYAVKTPAKTEDLDISCTWEDLTP